MSTQTFPTSTQLPGIDIKISRHVQWDTIVQETISGKETRVARRLYPRREFQLQFNFLRSAISFANELSQLEAFFNQRQGMFDSFLWTDPEDNAVQSQGLGFGDSTRISFALLRAYGGFVEPIYAPNVVNNVLVGSSVAGDFTYTQWGTGSTLGPGVITFGVPPPVGQPIVADLTFWYPVRFTLDDMTFDRVVNLIWENKKVTFRSII